MAPAACVALPVTTRKAGAPAVAVAVKVIGEPVSPADVAVMVLAPVADPRVHEPTVAMPLESDVAVSPVPEPPPDATAKVTDRPATGLPPASVTRTAGAVATAVPMAADCPLPADTAIVVAEPAPVGVIEAEVADVNPA